MKRKLLTVLCLLSSFTVTAHAFEIQHGKLISHQEWTDKGVIGSFKESKISLKKPPFHKSLTDDSTGMGIMIFPQLYEGAGVVGEPTSSTGFSTLYIENQTNAEHTYTIKYQVCAIIPTNDTDPCSYLKDIIQLEPDGFINSAQDLIMTYAYSKPGYYETHAFTTIQIDDSPNIFSTYVVSHTTISDRRKSL